MAAFAALCGLLWPFGAAADWTLNMRQGVTSISQEVYGLHMIILWVCVVIGIIVFGAMFWSILHHRKSKGVQAAHFHENTLVEIVWTLIPFGILIFLAVPATKALINIENTGNADLTIKVTGYQWKWRYEYLDHDIDFYSSLATPRAQIDNKEAKGENYLLEVDNHLVLPVGRKVRLLVTANDVIHSWWVPAFGTKKDAIPGFINELWTRIDEPGTYRGQCAELCGKDHGYMPIVVEALSEEDFEAWVAERKSG